MGQLKSLKIHSSSVFYVVILKLKPSSQMRDSSEIHREDFDSYSDSELVDIVIHCITRLVLLVFIGWIAIYLSDSAIHRLNNLGQVSIYK